MKLSLIRNSLYFSLTNIAFLSFFSSSVLAADIDLFAGNSFESAAESLSPGDRLIVHAGTYSDSGRISIQVQGTAANPVIIEAAAGEARPLITRPSGAAVQNTINIEGASYLTIRGLEITGNGGDAITMNGGPSFITLEDLEIHDIAVGVNMRSSMNNITVRRSHIYRTNDTGEGMYIGCNNNGCSVSQSLFEGNWIHDTTAASQGDGIEIKLGSHSNIIRDNVIHDTGYPCVLVYGTVGNPRNTIEGNVMWNCGDSGIQAASDAVIRNNIILAGNNNGFNSQSHQGATPQNLEFVHNTVIGGSPCLRLNSWDGKTGLVFANNAVYCPNDYYVVSGLSGVAVSGNIFEPAPPGFPGSGYNVGRSEAQDFLDSNNRNVYPTSDSALLGAGDAAWSNAVDFNGNARLSGIDAGAYAWSGNQNPGWTVAPGFKNSTTAASPTLAFSAAETVVAEQGSTTLNWQSSNTTSCTASDNWSGSKPLSGSEIVGPLSQDRTYTLTCQSSSGANISRTVSVQVDSNPPAAPTLNLSSSAASIDSGEVVSLSWTSANTSLCTAAGDWAGSKPLAGSEQVGPLFADSQFSLNCSGPAGSMTRSVGVMVLANPPGNDPPDDPPVGESGTAADSGSSALGPASLAALVLLAGHRRRLLSDLLRS